MSRDLPARASIEHLKKQAKALVRDAELQIPEALERFRAVASRVGRAKPKLADAQHVIAREYGFATWAALKEHISATARASDAFDAFDAFDALAAAVRAGDVRRADELLRDNEDLRLRLNEPMPNGGFGAPVLAAAVQAENRQMIDLLLRYGADVNARSHWWAGSFGALDICEPSFAPFLIDRGARVDAHSAARLGMLERLEELVRANPELVHARGGDGQTPLHFASTVEIAKFLTAHGADVDARDVDHESTPAQYMVRSRQDVARFLVERGCLTDILMASALGDIDLVRRHLDSDPDSIRTRVSDEHFPMRDARAGGTIYIWTLGRHKTAHSLAREFGHDHVFDLLMERSADELKLAEACELGDEALVRQLVARRPNLARTLTADERRKLVDAAENDNVDAVRLMLAAGWPAAAPGHHDATALHFAAWLGNAEMVRELLRYGAPLDSVERRFNLPPLGWALHGSKNSWRSSTGDYGAVVETLLSAGAKMPRLTDELEASDAVIRVLRRFAAR